MHIVLLGYRASGKSTTGGALSRALLMPLIDLDARIEAATHMPIAETFRRYGEPWFRAAEAVELEKALEERASVIALGGGAACSPASAQLLNTARAAGRAKTVYLRAMPETLRARLLAANNAHRPSLTGAGHPADEIEQVLRKRAPLYEAVADVVIDVDTLTPEQTAASVTRAIGEI